MASVDESQILVRTPGSVTTILGRPPEPDRDWLLLGLSREMNERIEELAMRTGDTKADLINKAIGVYKAASDAVYEGKRVGVAGQGQPLEVEWEGFCNVSGPVHPRKQGSTPNFMPEGMITD